VRNVSILVDWKVFHCLIVGGLGIGQSQNSRLQQKYTGERRAAQQKRENRGKMGKVLFPKEKEELSELLR